MLWLIVQTFRFARALHSEVLDRLHVLLAIALELPEDYFLNIHKYEIKSEVRRRSHFLLRQTMICRRRIISVT